MPKIKIETEDFEITLPDSEFIPATEKQLKAIVEKSVDTVGSDIEKKLVPTGTLSDKL